MNYLRATGVLYTYFILSCVSIAITYGKEEYATVNVRCVTSKGPLDIEIYPDWAPRGAQRFLELVRENFYTDIAMFRTVDNFLTQFGISDNPDFKYFNPDYKFREIDDDPDLQLGIKKHYLSFAGNGINSRATQVYIAFEDLNWLGPREGFTVLLFNIFLFVMEYYL